MKITLFFCAISLLSVASYAQSRTISKEEYEKVFEFAVTETNADYPHIFKVTTNFIENGKTLRTVTEINENESPEHHRIRRTDLSDGRETNKYQITAGFGNVFCSDDGVVWVSSEYECSGPTAIYRARDVESVEYSVTKKSVNGAKVKVYRAFSVFAPADRSGKRKFCEEISTVDSRGFFVTLVDTEGTLDPKTTTLIREQSWVTKAKIDPVVPPR